MDKTEDGLAKFLGGLALQRWGDDKAPFWLSQIVPALKKIGVNYHEIIGDEKLNLFVRRVHLLGGFKVVEHPTQRAKIGLIPSNEDFSFDDSEQPYRQAKGAHLSQGEFAVLNFLKALSRLNDDDLANISIPVNILVKLIGGK